MEKCTFVWMMGKKKALFLHMSESYSCFWFWRWFKKWYQVFFFVIVGYNFVLTENDVILILFWWWPCEISSTICFLLFVEAELNGIAIKTLFEGFVCVDWGTGTIKEYHGDFWLLLLERAQYWLGDSLARVLRRILRKRNLLELWASSSSIYWVKASTEAFYHIFSSFSSLIGSNL